MSVQTSKPCPFGAKAEIIITLRKQSSCSVDLNRQDAWDNTRDHYHSESSYGACFLAAAVPTLDYTATPEETIEHRQEHLKKAGCPKWKMRIQDGFWIFKMALRKAVHEECKYADGKTHLL